MSDTHILDLIEHYRWNIKFNGSFIDIEGANGIFTLSFQGSLREAVQSALQMQAKWALQ